MRREPGKHDQPSLRISPALRELMADPIVHMVMKSDRIGPREVWMAVASAQQRMASGSFLGG